MLRLAALLCVIAAPTLAAEGPVARPADWAAMALPSPGPTRSIGTTTLGCIAGAVPLPTDGPGWQAIRTSRNRHWGHPATVEAVVHIAGEARAAGLPDLWIGDMGQPRGGPLTFGHASHQTGLDVDVWLDLRPKPRMPLPQREDLSIPSLVLPGGDAVDPARWTDRHATLIRIAASSPGIDRVLVNPAIKRRLCQDHRGAAWLRNVRPWYGHDSHMHVRLRCQPGSPECRDQAPPPQGDGCDSSLEWWFSAEARRPPAAPPGPRTPPRLPAACSALLSAPNP
ncbi:penicillin-insensitive murein endopeptidase [Falsiroseomonas sp. HW251]|uniref:penicillin-insensitive murein endopeptidase n=1 Tax=Falsiroseomonas sp. HW251 TaxID=3390998 RepID=UPI003D31B284